MESLSVHEAIPQLYIALTAIVFNLVFWISLGMQGYHFVRSKRAFRNLTGMVMLANIVSCVEVLVGGDVIDVPPVIMTIVVAGTTMMNNLMALFTSVYFVHFFSRLEGRENHVPVFSYIVTGVKAAVLIVWLALMLPRNIQTGAFTDVPRLLLLVVWYGFNFYHLVFCLVFFLRRRRILRRKNRVFLYLGFAFLLSTIVLQAIIGDWPHIYYVGATIALLIFYFAVESPATSDVVVAQAQKNAAPFEGGLSGADAKAEAPSRERVRKRSVSGTVFALISVLMLVSCVLLGSYLYYRSRTLFLRELQTNALHSAESSAALVDALAHSRLKEGSEGSADYKTVQETLAVFREKFELEYVYTVIYNGNGIPVVCVDSDAEASDTFAHIGDEFAYSDATLSALAGEAAVDDTPLTDGWGVHLSAYAPVFLDGKVIAAAGVDVDYDWVNRELRQIVNATVFACALCLLISIVLLLVLSSYLKSRFRLLDEKIDVLSYDSEGLKKIDGLNSGDEFEMIADHINEVFEKNMAAQQVEADKLRSAMEVVEQKAAEKLALAEEKLEVAEGRLAQAAYLAGEGGRVSVVPSTSSGTGEGEAMVAEPVEASAPSTLRQVQGTAGTGNGEGLLPELDDSVTKEEAIRRVREAAPEILASYRALSGLLQPYFEPEGTREAEEDLPEIDPEELEELYGAILEFAEMYDEEAIRRLLEQTDGYAVPDAEKERFARVKELVRASDWSGLREALEGA